MSTDTLAATRAQSFNNVYLCMALLWLAGNGLRLTILAPAPVISLIHADLHLSETQVGLLSGIPAALFACAAVPGALLIARFGARATLIFGLIATAAGSALRGAAPDAAALFITTALTGFGVAVMQPAMPALVRAWTPRHIATATAVYTNGLLIGEVLPVALTLPVVVPLVGGWRIDFAVWGGLCVLIALVVAVFAPRAAAAPAHAVPRKWWPDWNNRQIWQLGIMMGCVNATYFSTNFFIPRYLHVTDRAGDISAALIALNVGQLPASVLLLFFGRGLAQRNWPYFCGGIVCLIAVLCIVFGNGAMVVAGAGLVGFAAAAVLILMLSLPAILSAADDVARSAAGLMAIGYSCAVIVPVFCGIAWDLSGVPAMAFLPLGICSVVLAAGALVVRIRPFREAQAAK
jgi:CP family cyanate transporter-like MFS transporter